MLVETYSNTLWLARKTAPRVLKTVEGGFCLHLLAYSRPANKVLVPWRMHWHGDDAIYFWRHFGLSLLPGTGINVELCDITLVDACGRDRRAEMHARINTLQLLPTSSKSDQNSQVKTPSSAYAACAGSY